MQATDTGNYLEDDEEAFFNPNPFLRKPRRETQLKIDDILHLASNIEPPREDDMVLTAFFVGGMTPIKLWDYHPYEEPLRIKVQESLLNNEIAGITITKKKGYHKPSEFISYFETGRRTSVKKPAAVAMSLTLRFDVNAEWPKDVDRTVAVDLWQKLAKYNYYPVLSPTSIMPFQWKNAFENTFTSLNHPSQ
jgi:hypothetical protein